MDAPLHVVYLKQLALIREKVAVHSPIVHYRDMPINLQALKLFKSSLKAAEGSEYEAMVMVSLAPTHCLDKL